MPAYLIIIVSIYQLHFSNISKFFSNTYLSDDLSDRSSGSQSTAQRTLHRHVDVPLQDSQRIAVAVPTGALALCDRLPPAGCEQPQKPGEFSIKTFSKSDMPNL